MQQTEKFNLEKFNDHQLNDAEQLKIKGGDGDEDTCTQIVTEEEICL
ncbi:hypothetical protein [Flavilitoribacter nigricans]|nr:hypothetical protein [Flavilitoribacter nigricans]